MKKVHQAQELDKIDGALETLNKAWEGAAQEMYAATGGAEAGTDPNAAAGGQEPQGGSEGDVSDVEFEEVDDAKK